jgi:hypothetical protein
MKIILNSKRHHYLAKFSVFLITVALIAGMVGCSDTSQNLEIRDWYDLDAIRDNLSGNHILMNDLDSTTAGYTELASPTANGGKGWQPIGAEANPFTGSFDGQGNEIRDLFINREDEAQVGLFGVFNEGGVLENVGMVNVDVTGSFCVGGLVGLVGNGTVRDSYSTGSLTGEDMVGGLVGANQLGTVRNSYSTGSLTGEDMVGGLVGGNQLGTVSNSYSSGNVTGEDMVGGLVGVNQLGTVSNSYSSGNVTGIEDVGGLVGVNLWGTVRNSYSSGSLTGELGVGGLVGVHEGIVSNSYYNYDEVLINGENIITIGALFSGDFEQWLANDKFLDVNERLSQENGYYVINNITDFKELLAFGQDNSLKFRLKNDIDLATEPNFYIPYLAGEFDGNGHRISNITFNFDFVSQVGFFGYLGLDGNLTQVAAEDVNITGNWGVGGLVGYNAGIVSNSYSSGNVNGDSSVGGLVGYNVWGDVTNSYSSGSLTGEGIVGGLVGHNLGTVSNSYSTGSVTGDSRVGGLVGWNEGTVSTSFWDTETSGQATSDGGTGKTTVEMQDIATFLGATWDICTVAPGSTNSTCIWNIVDNETYPFLSWESVS